MSNLAVRKAREAEYLQLPTEDRIRIAARKYGMLAVLDGVEPARIGSSEYHTEMLDVIAGWAVVDTATLADYSAAVEEEFEVVKSSLGSD